MNVLVWFRNDLRVTDHPALARADGPALPLVIVDPAEWADPARSGRQWAFRAECLQDLREALAALGAPLALRVGDPLTVLETLCRLHRIGRILCIEDPACHALDRRVQAWAAAAGVEFTALAPGPGAPATLTPLPGVEPGPIPPARALRIAEDRCPHRQPGGRMQGRLLLQSFLERRGEHYRDGRDRPLGAERICSRLSPHLATGTLSRVEVRAAVTARMEEAGPDWTRSLGAFRAALAQADVARGAVCPPAAPEGAAPPEDIFARMKDGIASGAARREALRLGETGLPFVDAAARALSATGWLPARLRGLLVSAAMHHLRLCERTAGVVIAAGLTDHAPAVHWARVRRAARARPVDPLGLAAALDPEGAFTRRWLPELADVPDLFLQAPWRWEGARQLLGRRYPEPLVDPATAIREARRRLVLSMPDRLEPSDMRAVRGTRGRRGTDPGQLYLDL
ncbi:FAD-binding domain-containing protein [Cereibacter azotoformans]|uniref:FAD-binding domain-containing protein n=1 Tax=Cereibacter azotoformans TaxID=43057 RepID=UPI003B214021